MLVNIPYPISQYRENPGYANLAKKFIVLTVSMMLQGPVWISACG
jgi:hypothetical protein